MRPRLLEYLASHGIGVPLPDYTVVYAFMALLGVFLVTRTALRRGLPGGRFLLATALAAFASLLCARLYGLFLARDSWTSATAFGGLVRIGETGSFGAYIGGLLGAAGAARLLKFDTLELLDIYAPVIALCLGIGRIGCFLAGCCYGGITSLPWAVTFPRGSAVYLQHRLAGLLSPHAVLSLPVHPTQLYESFFGFALAVVLFRAARSKREKGRLIGLFLVAYSGFRFLIEFIRADRQIILGPLSIGQLLALVTLAAGLAIMGRGLRRRRGNAPNGDGVEASREV